MSVSLLFSLFRKFIVGEGKTVHEARMYPHLYIKTYLSNDFQFGGKVQTRMVLSSDTDTNLLWSSVILTENITPCINEVVPINRITS